MSYLKKGFRIGALLTALYLMLMTFGCRKDEETELERKQNVTRSLNALISADSVENTIRWMTGMGTRFALADNHRSVAVKLMNRLKIMGYENASLDSFFITRTYQNVSYQQWQYNVTARLEGSQPDDSVSIIGAHYDDALRTGNPFLLDPGANDNASGTAATLELARVMKKFRYTPETTIEFVLFAAEELGLHGSYHFAGEASQNGMKIKMMLNNDMIGYYPTTDKTQWSVNIIDYDNSHELRKEAENMINDFSGIMYVNNNIYYAQSDSYPFFRSGFKALFFISNADDVNYHTLNDLPEKCNFGYCSEIARICCAILVHMD